MKQNDLPILVCLLIKQTFPNENYLSNRRAKNLRILITTFDNYEGPSSVFRRPTKGLGVGCCQAHGSESRAGAPLQCSTVCKRPSMSCGPNSAGQWSPGSAGAVWGCFQS